jgi:hypothetical protein
LVAAARLELAGDGQGTAAAALATRSPWPAREQARERGGRVKWFSPTEPAWSVWPRGMTGGPHLGVIMWIVLNKGPNCKTAVTFQIGVQKLWKIYFWKAKNMTNSNMLIDESVRNKKINHCFVDKWVMTHKYTGSQQSSREVKPKFIDSTQGEPKNIYKP